MIVVFKTGRSPHASNRSQTCWPAISAVESRRNLI
jgi:hypothetical protein